MAQSPRDRGWFNAKSGATPPPSEGPRFLCDRAHQSAPMTASNSLNFWAKILFKNDVFSHLFFKFWLIHEAIKRIWSKIISSSWSPMFTLDCEAIRARFIANSSLISSNFPLEFRTSMRKNPSKFASIHENWNPILAEIGLVVRFDRLSRGNLSFY